MTGYDFRIVQVPGARRQMRLRSETKLQQCLPQRMLARQMEVVGGRQFDLEGG